MFFEAIIVDFTVEYGGINSFSKLAPLEHEGDDGFGADVAICSFVKDLALAILAQQTQFEDLIGDFGIVDQADTADDSCITLTILDVQIALVDGYTTGAAGSVDTETGTAQVESERQTVGQKSTMCPDQRVTINLCKKSDN